MLPTLNSSHPSFLQVISFCQMHFAAILSLQSTRFHQPCSVNGYGGTLLAVSLPKRAVTEPGPRDSARREDAIPEEVFHLQTTLFASAAVNAPEPSKVRHLLDPWKSMWWRWRLGGWNLSVWVGIAEMFPGSVGNGNQGTLSNNSTEWGLEHFTDSQLL